MSQDNPDQFNEDQFNQQQLALIESTMLFPLRRRIMDLEGCLVFVKNFLPLGLKDHVENVLFPK